MLLEVGFFPLDSFPKLYLVSYLMRMLSIYFFMWILNAYLHCFLFWVMWKLSLNGCKFPYKIFLITNVNIKIQGNLAKNKSS
jgi:hypothetical protein